MSTKDMFKELYLVQSSQGLVLEKTALIIVDMQKADAHEDYGFLRKAREMGEAESMVYYVDRVKNMLIPRIAKLLERFRATPAERIYVKIESLTLDGRDRSLEHKRMGVHAPKGSVEAEILEELKPLDNEIIISKTASGAFSCTNLNYVLRNLGVETLVVCGVLTNECVENLVRDGADLSYEVFVVEDCCAAISEEVHCNAIQAMEGTYATIITSSVVEEMLLN